MSLTPTTHSVVAILLAAGLSTRAKPHNKLITPLPGNTGTSPIIRASAEVLLASCVDLIVVVTGYQYEKIEHALIGLDVRFAHNPDFSSGMAGSLTTGIKALPKKAAATIVALGDMPSVSPKTVDALSSAFARSTGHTICVPLQGDRRGNPVLFGARHFAALTDLKGDRGGKTVIDRNPNAVMEVPVNDPGIHTDFDII